MKWSIRETTAFVCSGPARVVAMDLAKPGQPLALEGSGAAIWRSLLSPEERRLTLSLEEVVARVAEQFDTTPVNVEPDVASFLARLEEGGLIEQRETRDADAPETVAPSAEAPWRTLLGDYPGSSDIGQLQHLEAIELAYALAHHLGSANGIRVLAIKGLVGVWHGLRDPRVPADVDVLVHPDDFDRYLAALADAGWISRLGEFNDFWGRHHSVTVINEQMPCDIDVHRWWPGFLADASDVFEELWRRSVPVEIAGCMVTVADRSSSILVMALHSLRSTPDNERHRSELSALLARATPHTGSDSDDLAALASFTAADIALEGTLATLGVPLAVTDGGIDPDLLRSWRERLHGRTPAARIWWRHVRGGSVRQWPVRIKTALWPSEELVRAGRYVPPGRKALNAARRRRLAHGLRTLPGALLAWTGLRTQTMMDAEAGTGRKTAAKPRPDGRTGGNG